MDYSPDVKSFLDEREKEEKPSNIPDFHPILVRLQGFGGKKVPANDGKYVMRDFDKETGKYLKEDALFGNPPHDKWGGAILKVTYMSEPKFNPSQKNSGMKICTQEFEDFQNDSIDLSKITFGEGGRTELLQSFVNYGDFKAKTALVDNITHNIIGSQYSLSAVMYVYHFSLGKVVKFTAKGSTRGSWFDYTKAFKKSLPEAKTLKQVKTVFGVKTEKNDAGVAYAVGTMDAHSLCSDEEMQKVIEAYRETEAWYQAIKSRRSVPVAAQTPKMDELPVIDIGEMAVDHGMGEEIDLSSLPF